MNSIEIGHPQVPAVLPREHFIDSGLSTGEIFVVVDAMGGRGEFCGHGRQVHLKQGKWIWRWWTWWWTCFTNEWPIGCLSEWMNEWINERTNEWMNEWVNKWKIKRESGSWGELERKEKDKDKKKENGTRWKQPSGGQLEQLEQLKQGRAGQGRAARRVYISWTWYDKSCLSFCCRAIYYNNNNNGWGSVHEIWRRW